jgi:DNA-binding response OmpR family regulator
MALEIIQIIEDDRTCASLLEYSLRKARFRTNVADQGVAGLVDIKRLHPALILLDVMLPGIDGYEVCRLVRKDRDTSAIPIIMISALGSEDHRLAGLDLGVDDYISKPFSPREVVARVQAVLRRGRTREQRHVYLGGALTLEESQFVVIYHGSRVHLSDREWRVLRFLAKREGQLVTTEEVISLLWGEDGLIHERELERDIQALKRKLESGQDARCAIHIIPNVGFRLACAPVNNRTRKGLASVGLCASH